MSANFILIMVCHCIHELIDMYWIDICVYACMCINISVHCILTHVYLGHWLTFQATMWSLHPHCFHLAQVYQVLLTFGHSSTGKAWPSSPCQLLLAVFSSSATTVLVFRVGAWGPFSLHSDTSLSDLDACK